MRFFRQGLFGLFITGVTLGFLLWAGVLVRGAVQDRMAGGGAAPRGSERVFSVAVITAQAGREVPVLTAFGQVQSRRSLEIRASVRGTIVELSENFVEGGAVHAGDVLARIDPRDAEAAVTRARTDVLDAEAEQREALRAIELARDEFTAAEDQAALRQRALERQEGLAERRVGTTANVEAAELAVSAARTAVLGQRRAVIVAEARVDSAATGLARAQLALGEAERVLADTVIRAEFDGVLSGVVATNGELVSQNEKLADLIDGDALEVAFQVSALQYGRLLDQAGALQPRPVAVSLEVTGADLTAVGQISRESAAVGAGQTGRQLFALIQVAGGLKPGDFVTVRVEESAITGVYRLPNAALGGDNTVLVLGDGDRLRAVPVQLLRRQGDDVLLRAQGLEGREVVRQRSALLGAGIKVLPLREGADGVLSAPASAPEMIAIEPERRARLLAAIDKSPRLPDAAKAEIRRKLEAEQVPAALVERIESRMGG